MQTRFSLAVAVTQVFDAGFHMDMQCDKGIMRDGGGVLGILPYEKDPGSGVVFPSVWIFSRNFL